MLLAIGVLHTVMATAGKDCDDVTARLYCNETRACCGWAIDTGYPDTTTYDMLPRKCSGE